MPQPIQKPFIEYVGNTNSNFALLPHQKNYLRSISLSNSKHEDEYGSTSKSFANFKTCVPIKVSGPCEAHPAGHSVATQLDDRCTKKKCHDIILKQMEPQSNTEGEEAIYYQLRLPPSICHRPFSLVGVGHCFAWHERVPHYV
jgi:hypothetical protein